jgi:hypothetical protein
LIAFVDADHHPYIPVIADALLGDSRYKELSNWIRYHLLVDFEAEYDGREGTPSARTIGIASRRVPSLHDRAGDKLPG